MPSLNSLRTKGGVVVTIIIFLALLAFILGDVAGLFTNQKLNVGEINGKKIDYIEFANEADYVSNMYKMMWGSEAVNQQQQEMFYNQAWNELIMKYSYQPGFAKLGIGVGEEEQVDMVNGSYISPVIASTFVNPQTGAFDSEWMKMFLQNANSNESMYAMWSFLKEQMNQERSLNKYITLVSQGFFATDMEVKDALATAVNRYDANVVVKNYSTVADSTITITSNEVRSYYNSHKEGFKRPEARDIEYVVFDVVPSDADFAASQREISRIAEEFRAAPSPMQFATLNTQERVDQRYYKESELSPELAAIAFGRDAGGMYGPQLKGDIYTISRLADIKMMPDSVGIKHILLEKSEKAVADSLAGLIRKGSDFTALAQEYSLDETVMENGGDLGRLDPSLFMPEIANPLIDARVGQTVVIESQNAMHIMQLTYKSSMVRKAQIATVTYKVDASAATMQAAYQRAGNLITAANGTLEGFREAASEEALPRRNAHITNQNRNIAGFSDSRELVRWAFNTKKTEVSSILELDGDYVVAAVSAIQEDGYTPVEEVSVHIASILRREAKEKMIADQMRGSSLDEIAGRNGLEVQNAADLDPSGFFAAQFGMEQTLLGALSASNQGAVSKPVPGMAGIYVFNITEVKPVENAPSQADAKIRIDAMNQYGIQDRTLQALTEENNIKDMRVRYF